jgi:arsenate reductase
MSDYTLIHNPKCSKSRQTLEILESKGIKPRILLYLEEDLNEKLLKKVFKALEVSPSECLRKKEDDFLNSNIDLSNEQSIIEAIIRYPKILERPIFICGDRAVIGRPPENVLSIIS